MAEFASGGILESDCLFFFFFLLLAVAVKIFSHLIQFIKKFYKRCTSVYYASDRVTVRKRVHSRQLQRVILR